MKQLLWVISPGQTATNNVISTLDSEFTVSPVSSLADALLHIQRAPVDLVLISLPQEGRRPEDLVKEIAQMNSALPIGLCGPKETLSATADITQNLRFYFVEEPVTPDKLQHVLDVVSKDSPSIWERMLVGDGRAMQEIREIIRLVGNRRSTVLITGETGTGKEIAARAIHMASSRAQQAMVAVNCAALPETLLEAELFGHTKGAFTGAVSARVGLFEQANRGTIFLDEIGEMPLPLQVKLLRVLQEREIQRIGSSETVKLDVRVIAASNCDLAQAVAEKRFRQDLFYRLNVVPLKMPPLRNRLEDIPALVKHFIAKICNLEHMPAKRASTMAMHYLMAYNWPGNVRQLEHAVESAIALTGPRPVLEPNDFTLPLEQAATEMEAVPEIDLPETGIDFEQLMSNIERSILERALLKSQGNKARAADLLKLKRTTLVSKFKALQSYA